MINETFLSQAGATVAFSLKENKQTGNKAGKRWRHAFRTHGVKEFKSMDINVFGQMGSTAAFLSLDRVLPR